MVASKQSFQPLRVTLRYGPIAVRAETMTTIVSSLLWS